MKITVTEPFRLVHAGAVYNPGDVADVDDDTAQEWLKQNWATESKAAAPRKRAAR